MYANASIIDISLLAVKEHIFTRIVFPLVRIKVECMRRNEDLDSTGRVQSSRALSRSLGWSIPAFRTHDFHLNRDTFCPRVRHFWNHLEIKRTVRACAV